MSQPLPFIHDTAGIPRVLGVLPPRPGGSGLLKFTQARDVVPRSAWRETDLSGFPAPILDQGQHGSCVGHGSVTSFWRAWLMGGGTHHDFSACYIYGQINGNQDEGGIISDAARCLTTKGVCLLSTVPEGMIYRGRFPAGADAEAARFKASLVLQCETFDDIASAIQMGFCIAGCVRCGDGRHGEPDFNDLDKYGVPPACRGPGNHCTSHCALVMLPDGRWALKTANSWSPTWGLGGYYYQTEAHYDNQPGVDAFAVLATGMDPEEVNLPPVVA